MKTKSNSKFYSKKPDVYEAIQWTGDNADELNDFASTSQAGNVEVKKAHVDPLVPGTVSVQGASGFNRAKDGDYIVKAPNGNLSVVSKEDFDDQYESTSAPKSAKKDDGQSQPTILQSQATSSSTEPVSPENNPALNPPITPAYDNSEETNKAAPNVDADPAFPDQPSAQTLVDGSQVTEESAAQEKTSANKTKKK